MSGRVSPMLQGRTRTLCVAVCLGLGIHSQPSFSQEDLAETATAEQAIEEIVVTGTRIARRDFNTSSPLATIDDQVIAFSGQPTLEETLNEMPQVLPHFGRTSNNPSLGNNPGIGGAEVDLRGLGPHRTLVLLNGRRVAPSGTDNRVDLNNIPRFLVERVEIITGGTSAVYGSDAIAGVVNFITREDFSGFAAEAGISITEQGDAETYDFSFSYGHEFADGQGNITVFASMLDRKSLLAGERPFTATWYYDDWEGQLQQNGSPATPPGHIVWPPTDFGNGSSSATFEPDGTPREFIDPDDLYNFAPVNYLQVPLERTSVGLFGHHDLGERYEAYVEASFVRNEPEQLLAPMPLWRSISVNSDNPVLSPEAAELFASQYACGENLACMFLGRRMLELGPRRTEHERDYMRIVAGIRGEPWPGWRIDGWITHTEASLTEWLSGDGSASRLQQGLLVDPVTGNCFDPSGGCVPLDLFGEGALSAEGVAFIRAPEFANRTERNQALASLFLTGSPMSTWAGPLDIAVGFEWRSDELSFQADEALFNGDTLFTHYQSPISGTEQVREFYGEAVIPLASDRPWARHLGLEIGARHSDHKYAGGVWTYKAGGEWQPLDGLRLRAMYQRSERAPNSGELFEEQRSQVGRFVLWEPNEDPCSASSDPAGNGNVEKCLMQGLPADQIGVFEATPAYPTTYVSGGNPDLESETGKTWTVGAVITPESLPNWQFTLDYFSFEVTDTIGFVDSKLVCFDPVNTAHAFCDTMIRDSTGNVARVLELTNNRGLMESTGFDVQVRYSGDLPESLAFRGQPARIDVSAYWTHMLSNTEQENVVAEPLECAGLYGWPCDTDARVAAYPEDRITGTIRYASGPLDAHLTWRWIEGPDNAAPLRSALFGVPDPDLAIPGVSDKHYVDIGFAYAFGDRLTVRFGIDNVLETSPPQMADAVWNGPTEMGLYDVFGRSYYLRISTQF